MTFVLVVDDEEPVRQLVRDVLELDGYDVGEAGDGPSALAMVAEGRPDCLVLDVMMPGMSGIDVLSRVRSMPDCEQLPVLMLTAAGDDGTTWAGWQAGASCYLPKPFDVDHLLSWVGRLIQTRDVDPALVDVAMTVDAATAAAAEQRSGQHSPH